MHGGSCNATGMHPEQVKIYKKMPVAKKLSLAASFFYSARQLKTQALKKQHPDWADDRVREEVYRIFLYASH